MARRVNTKFLIILTAVVVVAGVSALVVQKVRRGDPQKYVRAGDQHVAEKRYEEAARNYHQAVSIEPAQPAVWVSYGDALTHLVSRDPDNAGRAFKAWQQAVELDPRNKEALERVLNLYLAESEGRGGANIAGTLDRGRDVARRLAEVDPGNLTAVSAVPLFTVRGAMAGVQTDPQRLAEAAAELAALSAKHPANYELVAHAVTAKLVHAQSINRNQAAEAEKLVDEATALMNASLKAAPQSAAMQFQAHSVFSALGAIAATPEARKAHQETAKAALAEAVKLAKPQDEVYGSIHFTNAVTTIRNGDRAGGEKLALALLEAKPNDPAVRYQVAQVLSENPANRAKAIEILERPLPQEEVDPRRFMLVGRMETPTLLMLANLRLDEYAAAPADKRAAMTAAVEESLSKLVARLPGGADNAIALRVRGKFQRAQGKHVDAIQTLSKALTLQEQGEARDAGYYETMDLLARSYIDTRQAGPARELLARLVSQRENYIPGRLLLARLLLQDREFEAARPHVDYLEKALPNVPEVIKLRLALLSGADEKVRDAAAIRAALARLPETTLPEVLDKAQTAYGVGEHAEAERLLKDQLAKNPDAPESSVALARFYASRNMRDQAGAVVADALKAHPDNKLLQLLQKQLANATPEEMRQFRMDAIGQIADPAERAIRLAEVAMTEGRQDEALKLLQEAEKANPDNLRIKDALFNNHLANKRWNEAAPYLEALAKANTDAAGGLLHRVRFAMFKVHNAADPAQRTAELDKALAYARDVTQRYPEFGQSWLVFGQALQVAGKFEEATQRYATALEKQPDNLDAMRGMVESYGALGRSGEVKRYLDAALKISPNNPYFLEQQTNYDLAYGDPTQAVPHREKMREQHRENPQAWTMLVQAYLGASRHKSSRGDEAGAKELMGKAAATLKDAIAAFPDDRRFYATYADVAWAMKDAAGAEAVLRQFAARDAWKDKPEPQMMIAELHARNGKLQEAEDLLRGLITKDPANVNAQLMLASLLAQQNKVDAALALLQEYNAADPRVRERLVQYQISAGKLEEADKSIQAALAADPKSVRYQAVAGYVSMGRGRWDEADQRLSAALKIDPRDPVALYYGGVLRLEQPGPNVEEAVQRLSAARDGQPEPSLLADVRFALARALAQRNDIDGATRELEAALLAQPNNKRFRMSLIDLYLNPGAQRLTEAERTIRDGLALLKNDPDLLRAEAVMWLARKEPAKAVTAARQAVAAAPGSEAALSKLLEILLEAREYPTAIKEADAMLAANKDRWWAVMLRGVAKRYTGDKDGAVQDFEAALALAGTQRNEGAQQQVVSTLAKEIGAEEALARILPRAEKENRWRFVAAQLYQQRGNHDKAAEMVERILAEGDRLSQPERAQALRFAGQLYLTYQPEPQTDKAYSAYLKLLDLEPSDWGSLNNMAYLVAEQMNPPRPAEALKYSRRAYDVMTSAGGRNPLILDTHGWVLTLNNQPQEGIDLLRRAIAIQSFPEAHYHLGAAYLKTGAAIDAIKQLETAVELMRQAEEKKQPVDFALKARVEVALAKAKEAAGIKSAAANGT